MTASLEHGRFVSVIGTVDTAAGTGELLYVNPAGTRIRPDDAAPRLSSVEIVVEGDDGRVLAQVSPVVRASTCGHDGSPDTHLIQEEIPVVDGMKRVRLRVDGREKAVFEAGSSRPPDNGPVAMGLAPGDPGRPHRRGLDVIGSVQIEPGVTFTVEARPENKDAWQTLAVGRPTPNVELDWNQFPGTARVEVRVLRSTGFDEEVIAQEQVSASR